MAPSSCFCSILRSKPGIWLMAANWLQTVSRSAAVGVAVSVSASAAAEASRQGRSCPCCSAGGGVGGLCGSHIQHDVRGGHGLFQCGALVLGQVGAQLQYAIVLQVVLVGVLQLLRILLRSSAGSARPAYSGAPSGAGAFNAALLDAGVHDLAGVVRQARSQYACTNSSANTTRQTAQCRASCLKIFVMVRFSLRVNVARGIFRKNGIHQCAAQRVHLAACSGSNRASTLAK